ncbi:MAG: 3-isopropylmalate dehydratase small subunit [Deltaproteobacteria bacterium]|nr:3-isopropylmalate dehydratase small subunit [Deltaproteobacteria bacterium]
MQKFTKLRSQVTPIARRDVDTDMIIPAQYLTSISREGYGQNLFRRLRDQEKEFPLNLERYKGSSVLVCDANFGCGSSREHAVWALLGAGFRALIGKSFADIFSANSAKNGLLLIQLPEAVVDSLLLQAANTGAEVEIDLEREEVLLPGGEHQKFSYDPFRKHCLLNGLDDLDYILSHREAVERFKAERRERLFFTPPAAVTSAGKEGV